MLWFNFSLGLNFIFLCLKLIIIHYHTTKQRKIKFKPRIKLNHNIYTLSDLGDLSNLIGSLSRTIQQYSPPSEWIMCEFGVFKFPIFLENDLLKVDKILGLTFFKVRKDLYSCRRSRFLKSAFSNRKILAQKSKFIYDKQI